MLVKAEVRYTVQPATRIQVTIGGQRRNARCPGDHARTQSIPVFDRHPKPRHERARVLAEALLPRNEGIAVVRVLHGASLEIGGDADVVVRPKHETRSLASQPVANRLDFLARRFLFGEQVIESKDEQRIRIGKDSFIEWQPVAGLVDALKDGYRMS